MKKQSFERGALFIAATSIIAKIMSAVFKIPLDRYILHTEGMGIYNGAYSIYNIMVVILTTGFPIGISTVVAKYMSVKDDTGVKNSLKTSKILLRCISVLLFLVMFLSADIYARMINDPQVALAVRLMSLSLIFLGDVSALRGFFQGNRNMIPTSISQLTESGSKLLFGLLFGVLFINRQIYLTATASLFGVPVGMLITFLVLALILKKDGTSGGSYSKDTALEIIKIAIPITLASLMYAIIHVTDTFTVQNILFKIGYSNDECRSMYGYLGRSVTLYNLPIAIINAVAVSVAPAIASAVALNNKKEIDKNVSASIRLTFFIACPCCAGYIALAKPILNILYNDTRYFELVMIMGIVVIFTPFVQVTGIILQSLGKTYKPIINMGIACLIKIVLNIVFLSKFGIVGATASTAVAYLAASVFNTISLKKSNIRFTHKELYIRPVFAIVFVSVIAFTIYHFIQSSLGMIIAMAVCAALYFPVAFKIGLITKDDILAITKNKGTE